MKIETYSYPHSSFLSPEKDMNIIVNHFMKNERLKKLLFYTTKDALSKPCVPQKDALEMFGNNIKLVPKVSVDGSVLNYVIISFDAFAPNGTNPEFRDNFVEFDILCHFDQWQLDDMQLRPYKIAAELDTMFNNKKLTGLGTLKFMGANQIIISDEYAGLCVIYNAVHGEEDKKHAENLQEQADIDDNYDAIFNE